MAAQRRPVVGAAPARVAFRSPPCGSQRARRAAPPARISLRESLAQVTRAARRPAAIPAGRARSRDGVNRSHVRAMRPHPSAPAPPNPYHPLALPRGQAIGGVNSPKSRRCAAARPARCSHLPTHSRHPACAPHPQPPTPHPTHPRPSLEVLDKLYHQPTVEKLQTVLAEDFTMGEVRAAPQPPGREGGHAGCTLTGGAPAAHGPSPRYPPPHTHTHCRRATPRCSASRTTSA